MLRSESAIETRARSTARINQSAINAASPALGINLSTSSSAFETPPVPQVGIPATTNTNSSASTSATTNEPTQVTQLMQSLLSSDFRNNLSQPSSPAQVVPTAPLRQVPQSEYVTTSTAQSKLIEVIKFSNNRTSNREMLKQLNVMISECGLLSLVDGSRRKSIHTIENQFGYSPDSVRRVGLDTVLIPKDDLFRHKYDCGRLFTILFTVIQKDILYSVNQYILDKDGLACHTAITEHVHGTTNTDIRKAKHALEGLKIYDTKTVRENIATLEEAILNVENAQNCTMKP